MRDPAIVPAIVTVEPVYPGENTTFVGAGPQVPLRARREDGAVPP